LPQLEAVQTSPWRFTGPTFLVLSMASWVTGVKGDWHHKAVDLASLTCLASLADFVGVVLPVSFSPTEVATGGGVAATGGAVASALEVTGGGGGGLLCGELEDGIPPGVQPVQVVLPVSRYAPMDVGRVGKDVLLQLPELRPDL
jgi:hypothetical protein